MKMFRKVWKSLGYAPKSLKTDVEDRITDEIWAIHLNLMEKFNSTQPKDEMITSTEEKPLKDFGESMGKKFDLNKLSYTLLPFKAITEVVKVLEFGKQKYAKDNWQKVPNAKERYIDAGFRHLISYYEGETIDPESGLHHLAHATCCLLFVIWFDLVGITEER